MILVFGKNGQLASELGKYRHVRTVGREEVNLLYPNDCFNFIHSVTPKVVINAAAYTNVDKAEIDQEKAFKINVTDASPLRHIVKLGYSATLQERL